jgi:hypothetical protein
MPDDESNVVALPLATKASGSVSTKTTWTLLLYLTSAAEGCEGGETVFYPRDRKVEKEAIVISLETGTLLLHKHGDDCLLVCLPKQLFHFRAHCSRADSHVHSTRDGRYWMVSSGY